MSARTAAGTAAETPHQPPAALPRVSVIVPVRNRKDVLARLLVALDEQDFCSFEVIIVDDGSTDGSAELAARATIHGQAVHLLRQQGAGAVSARVAGVAMARGDVLAFTDSDCEPGTTWLSAGVRRLDAGADLAHGPTLPARPVGPLERSVNEYDGGLFPTANLLITRAMFDRVGGFDTAASTRWRFRMSGRARGLGFGEDTLLGWKVQRAGSVAFEPQMEVRHYVFPSDLREALSRALQVGAFPALFREIPELAGTGLLHHRVLFTHRSRVPMYATLVLGLTGSPRLATASAVWWATHRFRHTLRRAPIPWRRRLTALPGQMLLDAVQGTALVVGSARARRLLL